MESDNIAQLLDRYFAAETTLAEEQQLKVFFKGEVPAQLQPYKPLFGCFEKASQEVSQQAVVKLKPSNKLRLLLVAASVVVVGIGGYAYFNHTATPMTQPKELGSFDNPQKAFEETRKALSLLSTHVNKGVESMAYLQQYEQSKNIIFKN